MTRQRRQEIFNLALANRILKDYDSLLHKADKNKLTNLIGSRGAWKITPEYHQGGEDLDGRNVCEKGLCMFSRKLRNTLAYQYYKDIDMVNASYTFISHMAKKYNVENLEWVFDYIENREFILKQVMEGENCDRDTAKRGFTRRLFKGEDEGLNILAQKFIDDDIATKAYYESLIEKNIYNPLGKIVCYRYHKWEWKRIEKIQELFEKNGVKTFADLHDGFYIPKDTDDIKIKEMIDLVKVKFQITMAYKEMKDFLDIPREFIENYKKANDEIGSTEYDELRDIFEKTYGVYKVVSSDRYLLENKEDGYYLRNQTSLCSMFCDWKTAGSKLFDYFGEGGKGKRFIYNYVLDPDKRMVNCIDFYPNPAKCPSDVYNLFTGFHIESINDIPTQEDIDDYQIILDHIRLLVDDGEDYVDDCYEYVLDWSAQIFQEPDIKSFTMIIIKGGEGIGKSLLVQQLGYMMGEKYYYSTANCVNDLFGNFNSVGKNRLLINIDEVENSQTDKVYEQLKNLITRNKVHINEKFEKPLIINDYIRYLMTTNNEAVIKISDTNRRFVAFESIHPARKDIDKVIKAFFNDKALRLFYNMLMERDLSGRDWKIFPKTKYYKRCLDASISPTWKFLNDLFSSPILFEMNHRRFSNKIKKTELREHYEMWCMTNRMSPKKLNVFEADIESTYLFLQRRTSTERLWVFNEEDVITKLKKMGLYDKTAFLDD
tara:strand:- start:1274 stop:3415 length:2142 start_codon:yes stop_codon:yes gene_type:complete